MEESQPDVHSSADAYAQRFASRAGGYFLQTQLNAVKKLLAPYPSAGMLDVGGGHAQVVPALCDAGYDVTVHGSAESCRARPDRLIGADRYKFLRADPLALPVADQSYDVVIALRMMAHIDDPIGLIAELSRMARRAVVIDFACHLAKVGGGSRASYRIKNWAEQKTTRQFRTQEPRQVARAFTAQGLTADKSIVQYAMPMVVHRRLKCPPVSRGIEAACRVIGLTRVIGSPVLLRAHR